MIEAGTEVPTHLSVRVLNKRHNGGRVQCRSHIRVRSTQSKTRHAHAPMGDGADIEGEMDHVHMATPPVRYQLSTSQTGAAQTVLGACGHGKFEASVKREEQRASGSDQEQRAKQARAPLREGVGEGVGRRGRSIGTGQRVLCYVHTALAPPGGQGEGWGVGGCHPVAAAHAELHGMQLAPPRQRVPPGSEFPPA